MAAKATPLRIPNGSENNGEFHAAKFSMFESDDLGRYAELRNRIAKAANGIKVELMREYSRKTVVIEGSGEGQTTTSSEEIILVIHYWEKAPKRVKGDNDDELDEAKSDLQPKSIAV